ncbi:sensor histidine kinase [Paenibacillus sp. GCM10023248]|uniref:sensor histidine kinase n=1 Tax=Bacillales TaxID=1385 RepID=UPI0023787457|nr:MULTISPECIES: HAMP domain-containing sensor histidine kinase [Bacillales]MDD9271621.1 HAMP domain-containing sensor histidine kinase [Paenibacillus sp. MAHUQ-63]MDR6884022.1 signal transduction histidine kinase [Bacillus sp. 3255]
MSKLRVRTYALLSLVLLLTLPWIFFVTAHFITTQSLRLGADRPNSSYVIPMVAAFAGLLLAFVIVAVRMRRLLLLPLERMGQAARQIAGGDWNVTLPRTTIREIAEVRDGFEIMVDALQAANRKQAALEEERRFIIAAVAHDLRTPLFALRGYLDGLEQGIARSPEQIAKYVAVCKEKSAQLDRLVEDLFTFTKMAYLEGERVEHMEHVEIAERTVSLNAIVQQAIDSLRPQALRKHIAISVHYAPEDCELQADAHLLERAFSNVLDNAVRHTPEHGRILVHCRQEDGRITFTIHDSGAGFAPEELERIFEPLYRGEQSRSRSTGGAGLGLTISQRIIRQHGGELAASNHPDGGAVLSGWLPA